MATVLPLPERARDAGDSTTSSAVIAGAALLSALVHAVFFLLARIPVLSASAPPPPPAPTVETDHWTGDTAQLPGAGNGAGLYEVAVEPAPGGAVAAAPVAPAPPPEPAPVPPAPPPEPPAVKAVAPPDLPPIVAGLTDKAAPASPPPPRKPRKARVARKPEASASADAPEAPPSPPARRPKKGAVAAESPDGAGSAPPSGPGGSGSFGSEGAAQLRDLGRAFTRAIPPANQSDEAWASLPVGSLPTVQIALHVDETGHVTGAEPVTTGAPKQVVSLVRRTAAMLLAGTFALRAGSVSSGTQVLELKIAVSDVGAGAVETGGASQVSHKWSSGKGLAEFTQPGGRHVAVTVQVLRVEAAP